MRRSSRCQTYSTHDVARMTGATYRQVDYWARQGMIPGQAPGAACGSGHPRTWAADQVRRVRLLLVASRLANTPMMEIVEMLEAGVSLDVSLSMAAIYD